MPTFSKLERDWVYAETADWVTYEVTIKEVWVDLLVDHWYITHVSVCTDGLTYPEQMIHAVEQAEVELSRHSYTKGDVVQYDVVVKQV